MPNLKHVILLLFTSLLFIHLCSSQDLQKDQQSEKIEDSATYATVQDKPWNQLLLENTYKWEPPYTVHLPIQPVHSPYLVHVDKALNVTKRFVTPNVTVENGERRKKAVEQETWIVQFAFENPPVIPDFQLSTLALKENRYPLVTGDYYSRDLYYKINYAVSPLRDNQSLLWIEGTVTNKGDEKQTAHVRAKVNFQRENDLFNYHYIPFFWDAGCWLPYNDVSLNQNFIYKKDQIIGKVASGSMNIKWEEKKAFKDEDYNLNLRTTRVSGFVRPNMRLKEVQDVIHMEGDLEVGETKSFSLALLVNDQDIQKSDLSYLENATSQQVEEEAFHHFKKQFHEGNTELIFDMDHWEDIFTELQLSILQLLIKYPDEEYFVPTQGGSTERFYVWVWEAVHMLHPLLRLGKFDTVKKALDYIFHLQDRGVPPVGEFTTTEGSIGTTGPKWANTTGSALALASDYFLYSGDSTFLHEYLPKILKAGDWIIGEIQATRKLDSNGVRPPYYGLMPFSVATDGDIGYVISFTDAYTFWGLEKTVHLLEKIGHENAAAYKKELEIYRQDLLSAIQTLQHPNGFIDRKISTDKKGSTYESKFENVDAVTTIAATGVVDPNSELFQKFIRYYEKNRASGYFMGEMDQEITYIGLPEFLWQQVYLMTGEWKKAFMATQTNLKYGMTQDTYQTQERFSRRDPAFTPWQPNGSGNGRMLDMMLNSLYFENGEEITLLGGMPFEWLILNKKTALRNLHTTQGTLHLEVTALNQKECELKLSSADKGSLPNKFHIPNHFKAVSKESSVRVTEEGDLILDNNQNTVVLLLREKEEGVRP